MAPQAHFRKTRDNGRVGQALDHLRFAAEGTDNTMPYFMEAAHSYATRGEIIQVLLGRRHLYFFVGK